MSDSLAVDDWKHAVALMLDRCKAKYKPWIVDKEGKAGGQKGQNGQFRRFVSMGDGDDEFTRIRVVLYIQKNGEKYFFAFLCSLDFRFFCGLHMQLCQKLCFLDLGSAENAPD